MNLNEELKQTYGLPTDLSNAYESRKTKRIVKKLRKSLRRGGQSVVVDRTLTSGELAWLLSQGLSVEEYGFTYLEVAVQ